MNRIRACLLLVGIAGLAGCEHKSPLGTFSQADARAWAKDCDVPIVAENPHDPSTPGPITRDGGPAFERAARRYRCAPPGWSIYVDDKDQVLGLCVDDDTRPYMRSQGSFSESVDHEVDRARRLVDAHWGLKLAGEMLRGADDDHCSPKSAPVGHGLVRWGASQLTYPHPETIRSLNMCCWEATD
ncbi:MAG: hypothetical protein ABI467_07630 [Kofleriaceae bacterium]